MKYNMSHVGIFSGLIAELIGALLVVPVCIALGDPEHTARTGFYILLFSYIFYPVFISIGINLGGRALNQKVSISAVLWPLCKITLIITPIVAILALLVFFLEEFIYAEKGWGEYGLGYFGRLPFIILILTTAWFLVSYGVKRYIKFNENQTAKASSSAPHNSAEHVV